VADHAGLGWLALDATEADTMKPRMTPGHPDLLYYPTISCFEPLYDVARKERGIRMALTGVGSDQLFDDTGLECADALHALDFRLVAEMTGMRERPLSLGPYRTLLSRGLQPLLPAPLRRLVRAMRDAHFDSLFAHRMEHAVVTATRDHERAMATRAFPSLAARQLCEELERFTTAVPLWQSDQLGAWSGTAIAHPFLDRRVVDLAVAMPSRARWGHGWRKAKPVLRGAMRAHLPHSIADRRDAAEFSPYIREALFGEHRAVVMDLFANDCRLADLGVVDLDAIRRAFDSTSPFTSKRLGFAVSMELWLRNLWA
jgi:asparagine synthetase B (glutamine-hydrolysing)